MKKLISVLMVLILLLTACSSPSEPIEQEKINELDRLRALNTPATVIDAPQLFEAGADRDCNVIVSVLADTALRMERIMRRDGIDSETAKRRIEAQKSDAFFRSHSDYIIENNENLNLLLPAVERILLETGVRTE